jgi:hypothetical protein
MKITKNISITKKYPTISDTLIGFSNERETKFVRFDIFEVINLITDKSNENKKVPIYNEIPLGNIDGINAVFLSRNDFVPGSLQLFINGMFQNIIEDFQTIGNNTISLKNAPNNGETILINYTKY